MNGDHGDRDWWRKQVQALDAKIDDNAVARARLETTVGHLVSEFVEQRQWRRQQLIVLWAAVVGLLANAAASYFGPFGP